MATNSLSSTIVLELLRNNNYANWCVWMKNYLVAQDLWDVVNEPPKLDKAWTKNNAAALHAILISCEVDILPKIREITSVKEVWDKLASMYGPNNSSSIPGAGRINNDLLEQYEPLRTAINNGDWDAANDFLSNNEDAKSARITDRGSTVIHVAVFAGSKEIDNKAGRKEIDNKAGRKEIVEKLVELLSKEELEIKDDEGFTALAYAAIQQHKTEMLDCILEKNPNLLNIPDHSNRIPLIVALEYGNIKVARYLYSASLKYHQRLSDIDASTILTHFVLLNHFGLALHFLQHYDPRVAVVPNKYDSSPLAALAEKSSAFPSGTQLDPVEKWIYDRIPISSVPFTDEIQINIQSPSERQSDQGIIGLVQRYTLQPNTKLLQIFVNRESEIEKNLRELKKLHQQARQLLRKMCSEVKQMNGDSVNEVLFQAIKGGIVEFIDEILGKDHHLLYTTDTMGRNILFYAVLYRQDKIFRHIMENMEFDAKNLIINARDKSSSTILHMAAMLESSTKRDSLKGEVLKIQCELKWFKEVESHCLPWIKEIRNDTKMTARELFTHNHRDMMKEGEKWMKKTATSSTVIGALIITIMFTAAITVPGGNNQNTGFPMFLHKTSFMVFIICDALSLFLSTTSVLIFFEILTLPPCGEEDFLKLVPKMMVLGHETLKYSIITMIIAFCATLFSILPQKTQMLIPIFILAYITGGVSYIVMSKRTIPLRTIVLAYV